MKQHLFGDRGLCPLPLRCDKGMEQGDCAELHLQDDVLSFPGRSVGGSVGGPVGGCVGVWVGQWVGQ